MATKQCKSTLAVFSSWDDVFVFCVAYLELEYLIYMYTGARQFQLSFSIVREAREADVDIEN